MIQILIVDDHEVVRKGYGFMLKAFDDLHCIGEAVSGEHALELCKTLQPDVVLMDIHLPDMHGVDVIRAVIDQYPDIKILALTSYEDKTTLVQETLEAGAKGFIYKNIKIEELASAIRRIYEGQMYLSSEATQNLVSSKTSQAEQTIQPQKHIELSKREQEILEKLVQGLTNREIANDFHLSPNTVKFHVRSLLRKLNATTRTEAVSIALKYNLLDT